MSWPNALSSVKNSTPKLIIVNQCAIATTGRRDILVWPRNSRSRVRVRSPGLSTRVASGWPSRNTLRKCRTVLVTRAMATAVTARHTTSATICRGDMAGSLLTGKRPHTCL